MPKSRHCSAAGDAVGRRTEPHHSDIGSIQARIGAHLPFSTLGGVLGPACAQTCETRPLLPAEERKLKPRVCWDSSGVYHSCRQMDHGGEALIGLVGAHCDAFELLEPAEKVLDEMAPFVHLLVDGERPCAARMLGDDDFGAARVEIGDNGVAVERLVGDQRVEGQSLDERRHTHRVEALSRQKHEAHEIAERIGEGQDFGGHAAFRTADRLVLSPPFAPCPWRWTLTMVASTMAYSMSGSSETASNSRFQISAFTQSRKRVNTLFQ